MRRPSRRAIVAASAAAIAIALVAIRLWAPGRVRAALEDAGRAAGLQVTCDDVTVTTFSCRAVVTGFTVKADGETLLTAPRVVADTTLGSLFGDDLVLDALEIEDGVVDLVVDAQGRTNLYRALHPAGVAAPRRSLSSILVRDLRITRCRVRLHDTTRVPGIAGEVHAIDARGSGLQFGPRPDTSIAGSFEMDAQLAQRGGNAPFSVVAWSLPTAGTTADAPTFVGHFALTDLDLTSFPAYVDDTYRQVLGADRIDLVLSIDVTEGVIAKGAVVGSVPGREEPLTARFSGDWTNPTVDKTGALTMLFELPFARFGHVGTAVWRTGSSVVGGAVGFVEHLGRGDLQGAGGAAATGLGDALASAGKGLFGALKDAGNALGIGGGEEKAPARDANAIHAQVRERLLEERRTALPR